jgi:uncharacterized protein (DUF983 family)
MQDINPYTPPTESHDEQPMGRPGHNLCPSCLHRVSRWKVWKTLTTFRCEHCGDLISLEVSGIFSLVMVMIGLGISGCFWWAESNTLAPIFMIVLMPFIMAAVSTWIQVTFGTLKSNNQRRSE